MEGLKGACVLAAVQQRRSRWERGEGMAMESRGKKGGLGFGGNEIRSGVEVCRVQSHYSVCRRILKEPRFAGPGGTTVALFLCRNSMFLCVSCVNWGRIIKEVSIGRRLGARSFGHASSIKKSISSMKVFIMHGFLAGGGGLDFKSSYESVSILAKRKRGRRLHHNPTICL